MSRRIVQFRSSDGSRRVALLHGIESGYVLREVSSTYELASRAIKNSATLEEAAAALMSTDKVDPSLLEREGRLLAPIDHLDPAHLLMSGTGLTHLGSAESRDRMHRATASAAETDSMRMFKMGLQGGKPAAGEIGVQPEWFYKGDGAGLIGTGQPLRSPAFALDAGEEPELAGIYIIDPAGCPRRLGVALANEFSDHVTERHNYLWLSHSKLRPAALGPELLLGAVPAEIRGISRILRDGKIAWEQEFLSGEANMSHSIANLEHHHFKYASFRRPGDIHIHFFGAATLSFTAGVKTQPGDVFEIAAAPFFLPLRNRIEAVESEQIKVLAM